MKQVVFFVPQISQPRPLKRINSIYEQGFDIKVYAFDNGLYQDNISTASFPFTICDNAPKKGKLFSIMHRFKVIRRILKENEENTIFYFFDYKPALTAWLLGCRKYVYEESDVDAVKRKTSLQRRIAVWLDKRIIKSSLLTVFTSAGFAKYLFGDKHQDKYIILPNKLNQYFLSIDRDEIKLPALDSRHIKFGFIGLIRYPETILRFARVISEYYPQHEFHFYGDKEKWIVIPQSLKSANNVFFHGYFKNPQDLLGIYEKVDINIACYDAMSARTEINVKIAEPNKLYESIFFKTPLVVSIGTYVSERVKNLGVGTAIDAHSDDSIKQFVDGVNSALLEQFARKEEEISVEELVDNPKDLIENLSNLTR